MFIVKFYIFIINKALLRSAVQTYHARLLRELLRNLLSPHHAIHYHKASLFTSSEYRLYKVFFQAEQEFSILYPIADW